jgi:hypothetical protein
MEFKNVMFFNLELAGFKQNVSTTETGSSNGIQKCYVLTWNWQVQRSTPVNWEEGAEGPGECYQEFPFPPSLI